MSVTVSGGLFDGITLTTASARGNAMKRMAAQALARQFNHAFRELALTLNGAVAGSAAVVNRGEVEPDATVLGGLRTIDTLSVLNRNTTATDKANIDADLLAFGGNMTPVANGDGNPLGAAA